MKDFHSMTINRDIELLYEIATLRHMQRGWIQHLATNCANDLEHTMRVVFTSLILARMEDKVDESLIIKMALVHDIAETRTSDHSYIQKTYVSADEERAIHDTFNGTILEDMEKVVQMYERRDTLEAKIVKDADNLDIDLELKELTEQGHTLPRRWALFRKKIRTEKLYTDSAKKLWDAIQDSDPASWHMTSNKWVKIANAGK